MPPPAQRATTRKDRRAAAIHAAAGVVLATAAAILLLLVAPAKHTEERDFLAAPICPAAAAATGAPAATADCLRPEPFTVVKVVRDEMKRTPSYELRVADRDGMSGLVPLKGQRPVVDVVKAGDQVTAWYWRGEIRAFGFRGKWQYTDAAPTDDFSLPAAIGLGLAPFSLAFLWSAYWLARRSDRSPRLVPWQTSIPFVAALGIATAGAPFGYFMSTTAEALRWTASIAMSIALVAAAAMVRCAFRDRRKDTDTVEIAPLVPTREEVFAGAISGDVPYSEKGYRTLVASPGRLVSSLDPAGRMLRKAVPGTLVVERVRPVHRTDPVLYMDGEALVAECRDGEKQVLITVGAEHMGWVLGALLPDGPAPVS
ncbi:hypothetical protein [Streptomyces hesseae]|uniref:Uncharacterized protein n=1 Tax=Streptomyces hesseae TaxID=3075519 RepID=A0ABU2SRK5_9ACTN|nr:hypothetical protein [Streptomyces sp. DSM 40473]MDT0450650.1 hypothetical protein [Streptomyces sp. DSM 40473]